ncbi:S41 family peptidase [Lysobacter sp. CA196]|uniref:S41 family peptidase n=1 Tax=Lysobacter sp. CA196 TaxID=3455606 RepID=UPI003F8D0006
MRTAQPLIHSLLAPLLLLCLPGIVYAAAATPRDTVADIASRIQDHYYDVDRAAKIGEDLRKAATAGEFDRYTDPRDLATALTERIKSHDGHFRVNWLAPEQRAPQPMPTKQLLPGPGPGPAPRMRMRPGPNVAQPVDYARRRNYGVHRVEILPGNLGYLDLKEFADFRFGEPNAPARVALESALQLLASTDALIIDLRDNGGGSPVSVGYLVSAFTPKGADIYSSFHWRDGDSLGSTSEAPQDWYPSPRLDVPLYLLTSPRTASAAEALVYTLKNAGRAVVIGETSAGAANPGAEIDAGNGFSVFVATGSPTSPITHRNWEGSGIAPDVAVPQREALRTAQALALEGLLKNGLSGGDAADASWALDAVRAESQPASTTKPADYTGQYDRMRIEAEAGRLYLRNGKRPQQSLAALERDLFYVVDDPSVRVRFERDGDGRVAALETLRPDGSSNRYRR